jgi:hypothetical protein
MASRLLRVGFLLFASSVAFASAAAAQILPPPQIFFPPPADPRVPLGDLLSIVFEERDVIAFSTSGGSISTTLEIGESVRWHDSRGAVGVVLTDRRILAVGSGGGSWQALRYQRGEAPAEDAELGDRVALILTSRRAVVFGAPGTLVDYRLGPHEKLLGAGAGSNVAVAITDRKLLGYSPFVGGFFDADFDVGERLEDIALKPNLATVTTDRRFVVFRAETGVWSELRRPLT